MTDDVELEIGDHVRIIYDSPRSDGDVEKTGHVVSGTDPEETVQIWPGGDPERVIKICSSDHGVRSGRYVKSIGYHVSQISPDFTTYWRHLSNLGMMHRDIEIIDD